MKKLFLLLILSFFSSQGFAGSCPDGSEPIKSISEDGTYFVFNCGSTDTSANTPNNNETFDEVKPKELEASIKSIGEFDLKKLGENSNPSLYAFGNHGTKYDINQDGYDDLVIGIGMMNSKELHAVNELSKPVILFWNNEIKEYVVDTNVQKSLPFLNWPRRIHGSINPKTGLIEIFIASAGQDLAKYDFSKGIENLPPNCGGQNHLITFDPSTGEVAEIKLPKLWDYSHGLAADDINGDGVTDYVVLNSPFIQFPSKCQFKGADYTNENYILYSKSNGGFEKVNITLNYKGWTSGGKRTHPAGAIAIDKNDVYLILGSSDFSDSLYAFKQESKSSFIETSQVAAPSFMRIGGKRANGVEVQYVDIDNDGSKEVISALVNPNHDGRYIQILDLNDGEFKDRSSDIAQSSSNASQGKDWCDHLYYSEETSWNEPILTCTNMSAKHESRGSFYVWSDNKLQIAKMKFQSEQENDIFKWTKFFYPMNMGDKTFFVGRSLSGKTIIDGVDTYNSIRLNLIQPPLSKEELEAEREELEAERIAKILAEKNAVLTNLVTSDAFDGSFSFNFTGVDKGGVLGFGYGTLNIKNGIASISKDSQGVAKPKYQSFEGRVDQNGYLTATLIFNPCGPHCINLADKLIIFEGDLENKKLSGMYDDIKLYFYLVKK